MIAKSILKYALLAFLLVAVVVMAGKEMWRSAETLGPVDSPAEALPQDGLVVYYLHGEIRCMTCRRIEVYAQEAVESHFADKLAEGIVQWHTINYESPSNDHLVEQYEIVAPTVVLVRTQAGRQVEWRNLSRVWELVSDKQAFGDYIAEEMNQLLALQ